MLNTNNLSNLQEVQDEGYEFRCNKCQKLLGMHYPQPARLEVKCGRCGEINSLLEDELRQVYLTTAKGVIIYVNEQVETVTGYTAKEVLGKTPAVWGRQMPQGFYKDLWQNILIDKKAVAVPMTNRRKDGVLYEAISRISPILNDAGEVQFFLGIQTVMSK